MMRTKAEKMFDAVFVLGYTRECGRIAAMEEELFRVGLDGVMEVVWNYPSPLDAVIGNNIRLATDKRYLNVILGHYRILKTAQELGMNHILVLEDDARFLLDNEEREAAFALMPYDYDVALLDHHWASGTQHREETVNGVWAQCLDKRVSSAAYALGRRGIEWLVGKYEECFKPGGEGLCCCDQYFTPAKMPSDFNFYIATPNVVIQKPVGKRVTAENDTEAIYTKMGIDTKDYGHA